MSVQPGRTRIPHRQDQLAELRRERNRPRLVQVAHDPEPEPEPVVTAEPEQSEQPAETESEAHASEPAMVEAVAAEAPAAEPVDAEAAQQATIQRFMAVGRACLNKLTQYGIPVDSQGTRYDAEHKALIQLLAEKGIITEQEMALRVHAHEAMLLSQMLQRVEEMRLQAAQQQGKPVVASRGGIIVPGRN